MPPIRIDRHQVECEARAKALWGDPREEVLKYLMIQGIDATDATEMVDEMFAERAAIVRGAAIKKIFLGLPMMALPVVSWIYFAIQYKFIPLKLWSLTLMVGIFGIYWFLKGMIMFFSPGSEPGDVSEK
jgi:hypothetical protein